MSDSIYNEQEICDTTARDSLNKLAKLIPVIYKDLPNTIKGKS